MQWIDFLEEVALMQALAYPSFCDEGKSIGQYFVVSIGIWEWYVAIAEKMSVLLVL